MFGKKNTIELLRALAFSLMLLPLICFSQSDPPRKAVKAFERGNEAFGNRNFDLAEAFFREAIEADSTYFDALIMLGEVYEKTDREKHAIKAYNDAITVNPEKFHGLYYLVAGLEYNNGLYEDALKHFTHYTSYPDAWADYREIAARKMDNCRFAIEAVKNPVPFEPINLGTSVNSPKNEYFPCITADNKTLLFTRLVDDKYSYTGRQEDFFISSKSDQGWQQAVNLGPPINSPQNEGAPSLSADGSILVFTACEGLNGYGAGRDGYGRCDLFISERRGIQWTAPVNLGPPVNSRSWESQPCLSSDGRTLYFISNRDDNYDIWVTARDEDGDWSIPEKLGPEINTEHYEGSVYIHPDNRTLYFSSDGHTGMGGLDIFYSRKDGSGNWQKPVNLGYPINTFKDENSILISADGELAFFASDREGGSGGLDIYEFKLYDEAKPGQVTYMKGVVFDSKTGLKLGAEFELIDLKSGSVEIRSGSDPVTGEFLVCLPAGRDYALNVSKNGYLFYSDNIALENLHTSVSPMHKDVPLNPISAGERIVLRNIFFETDKYELKEESLIELDRMIRLLEENPSITVEIGGHTDNTGTPEYNLTLSENRARAVYTYIVENAIAKDRLSYKGYGETRPIDSNETEAGRSVNRRTEFRITGSGTGK